MKTFSLLAFLVFFAAFHPLFCASLEELVGTEMAAALTTATGPISEVQQRNPTPRIVPSHGQLRAVVGDALGNLEPNLFVETLSLYKKPRGGAELWNNEERTGLYNQLVTLSSLTGIQYYSESRRAMRTFYENSQVIDGPENKRPLPDPVFTAPPASLTLYARQKDLTFGDNIYRFEYFAGTDTIIFIQENLTAMNAGIIPAVGKNKYRTVLAAIDTGDSILIYAAAMAKTVSLPGMGDRIGASFTNRMQAVLTWFAERADRVF